MGRKLQTIYLGIWEVDVSSFSTNHKNWREVTLIGGASIHPHIDKRSHVAEFGIFIRNNYRNLGLGTAIAKTFIEIAKKRELEVLQLSVYATNKRAFHVYKKCGYKECGKLTRDIQFLDGAYTDRILMELLLK